MEALGGRTLRRAWRILDTGPGSGPWNMALDEALTDSVRAGGLPFLRFYTWQPATLSLGRFQNTTSGLTEEASRVPRVRRMTGGGGIWHATELTYSLGCRQDDLNVSGVKASFELLCGFLLDAWRSLGWEAHFAKDAPTNTTWGAPTPACFAGTEEYDVLVGGRKLGGNAQRRDREVIFQHGSIPLLLDHEELKRLFLPEFRPDPNAVTDLATCGWKGTSSSLISLLTDQFQERLAAPGREASPTDQEQERATVLVDERYGAREWTENGGGSLRGPS